MTLHCTIWADEAERRHHGVRFFCQSTGLHYCISHAHEFEEGCCGLLGYEIWSENDWMVMEERSKMPLCPICKIPLPEDLKTAHIRKCAMSYVKGKKKEFVPDERLLFENLPAKEVSQKEVKFKETM